MNFVWDHCCLLTTGPRDIRTVNYSSNERRSVGNSLLARNAATSRAGARLDNLDHIVFYDKPFLKFERLMETYIALAPRGFRSFRMAILLGWKQRHP